VSEGVTLASALLAWRARRAVVFDFKHFDCGLSIPSVFSWKIYCHSCVYLCT
jgi:hypothetical protein